MMLTKKKVSKLLSPGDTVYIIAPGGGNAGKGKRNL